MKTYTEKFEAWFEAEKAKGLLDVKFFTGKLDDSSVETFSREALDILQSKKISCQSQDL